jgi:hypothetical protein
MKAARLWALWQAILLPLAVGLTRPGKRRLVEWATGLALNVEEHTVTQSLIAAGRAGDCKALGAFAEHGCWDLPSLQWATARRRERLPHRLWHGYRAWAGDDGKAHRARREVWGTCTLHEYTARCPNRASTARAHHWLVTGALVGVPGRPALFLPVAGRLYFRKAQPPRADEGPPARSRTECELLVEALREHAKARPGKDLGALGGALAVRSVVRPLVKPDGPGLSRVDALTRLRHDARRRALPPAGRKQGQRGARPRWGRRLPPPRRGGRRPGARPSGKAFLHGRGRSVLYEGVSCQWHVLGHDVVAKAVVATVEGHPKRLPLASSATGLSGLQVVGLFCARLRQEGAVRGLKQRPGWEQCRAWTRRPIERAAQARLLTRTALPPLQLELQEQGGGGWRLHPPWDPNEARPSVLDVGRLRRRHREGIQRGLADWLGNAGKAER